MQTLRELKTSAEDSARWRSHHVSEWSQDAIGEASAYCTKSGCDATMYVNTMPPANGIDVGGDMVALNCQGRKVATMYEPMAFTYDADIHCLECSVKTFITEGR